MLQAIRVVCVCMCVSEWIYVGGRGGVLCVGVGVCGGKTKRTNAIRTVRGHLHWKEL